MTETVQELRARNTKPADENSYKHKVKTGISGWLSVDKSAGHKSVLNYLKNWDGKTDTEAERIRRMNYCETVQSYYNVVTDFYEYGWGYSFHFSRFFPGDSFKDGIARHEHYIAYRAGITENDLVLDVGCGVGGPAREIVRFTGCNVVGYNNNDYQITKANHYNKKYGFSDKIKFVKGDFMNMEFENNTFDKIYAIEATCHAPTLEGVYRELYRVLKPGGTFAFYEWVMTDSYDENNPEHRNIAYQIEVGCSIPKIFNVEVARQALRKVGFEIIHDEDLAEYDDSIPWYYPLNRKWSCIKTFGDFGNFFRTSYLGRRITKSFIFVLEMLRMVPRGSGSVVSTLDTAAKGLVAGGESKIFTPMMLFVAKKPLKN